VKHIMTRPDWNRTLYMLKPLCLKKILQSYEYSSKTNLTLYQTNGNSFNKEA
jgi:hypothetical protein